MTNRAYTSIATALCLVALLSLAGCRTDNHSARSTGSPVPSSNESGSPVVSLNQQARLPLDDYAFSYAQMQAYGKAVSILADRCMRSFGFAPRPTQPRPPAVPQGGTILALATGVSSPASGFRLPQTPAAVAYTAAITRYAQYTAANPPSRAFDLAYWGTRKRTAGMSGEQRAPGVNGQRIYAVGCYGHAEDLLSTQDLAEGDPPILKTLINASFAKTSADAAVTRAALKWSACMRQAGFDYATPIAASSDPVWGDSSDPSPRELATARRSVQCATSTGYARIFYSVLSRHESALVEANAEQLALIKATLRDELKRVSATLRH